MSDEEDIKPTNDIVFQAIFGQQKNKEITEDFLSCILGRKVTNINLDLNKRMIGNYINSKAGRLDVRAKFNDGEECNIEMQLEPYKYMDKRMLEYWSSMYNEKIKKGDDYGTLKTTISILITGYKLSNLKHIPKYHTIWNFREIDYPQTILTNDIEFHILEMPKTKITQVDDDKLALWLEFLKNPYSKEVIENMKKEENKYLKQAEKELQYLKGKPEFKRLVEAREGFLRDQHAFETAGLERGQKQGLKQGQIKIAKKLLHMNMPIEQIMEITELSKGEIEKLK